MNGSVPATVLELGDSVRSGYCGLLLRQWGARVVRLAPSQLPETTSRYLSRGKVIDPDASSRLQDWTVVIAPSSAAVRRWCGQAPDEVAAETGGPVVGVASLLGERGDYATAAGGEPEAFALSGLMSMIGELDREPLRLGGHQAENAAALALFTGVWFALYQRAARGRASVVRTSAVRATAYLDWKTQVYFAREGRALRRGDTVGPVVLRCADGHVGFYFRDEEWPAVKKLMGEPRLEEAKFATQLGRDQNRAELIELMEGYSLPLTKDEIYHTAQALKIPAGPVLTLADLPSDPQLCAQDSLAHALTEDGRPYWFPRAPWVLDGRRGGE